MTKLHGIVRGSTIELTDETGHPDGTEVTVIVEPVPSDDDLETRRARLKRLFGVWADDDPEEFQRFLDESRGRVRSSEETSES